MTINLLKILRSRNDVAIPAERAPRQKNNGLVVPTLIFLRQNDKANFFSPQPWRGRAVLVRGRPHRLWPCWAGRRERPPLEYRTHRPCSQPWPLSSADFALTARPVGITVPPHGQHGCPGHDPECRQRCQARAHFGAVGRVLGRQCALLAARRPTAAGRRELRPLSRPRITKAPQAPSLRTLVRHALKCQSAEELAPAVEAALSAPAAARGNSSG